MATEASTGTLLTVDEARAPGTESTWDIDPKHSLVEFAVRHMMFTTVRGRFNEIHGTIHCADEADVSRAARHDDSYPCCFCRTLAHRHSDDGTHV